MYENNPFPPLSLEDTKLISSHPITRSLRGFIGPSQLPDIIHHIFQGRLPSHTLRILFAGAGTGTSTILLSNQLRTQNISFEAVHFDLSQTSVNIAKKRADISLHSNIRFIQGSLLNAKDIQRLQDLEPKPFDYIDCVGMLMATVDPTQTLKNLGQLLTQDGGIGVMVYATYGRAPIYQVRRTMQLLSKNKSQKEQLQILRKILYDDSNFWANHAKLSQHAEEYDDISLVDTYLHPIDRSFTVPEIFEMINSAELHFASFTVPLLYDPSSIPSGQRGLSSFEIETWTANKMTVAEKYELAETMDGTIERHEFYVTKKLLDTRKQKRSVLEVLSTITVLRISTLYFQQTIIPMLRELGQLIVPKTEGGHRGRSIRIPADVDKKELIKIAKMIDGKSTSGMLLVSLKKRSRYLSETKQQCDELKKQIKALEFLNEMLTHSGYGVILFKYNKVDVEMDKEQNTWVNMLKKCENKIYVDDTRNNHDL